VTRDPFYLRLPLVFWRDSPPVSGPPVFESKSGARWWASRGEPARARDDWASGASEGIGWGGRGRFRVGL